jgi:hypothetical protein
LQADTAHGKKHNEQTKMTKPTIKLIACLVTVGVCAVTVSLAADAATDTTVKDFMAKYHKAPAGTDTITKKASDGKATPEELKELVAGYTAMTKAKPVKGDQASWTEKTTKLLAAAQSLQKGEADGITKYKEAVNCRACHTLHRP